MARWKAWGRDIEGHPDLGADGTLPESVTTEVEARRAVERMLRDGDWDTSESYLVLRAYIAEVGDADEESGDRVRVRVVLDQDEPDCLHGADHEWEDGEPYCSGGSTATRDTCTRCGAVRVSDGWGQDPETGEQGLAVVYYEDAAAE